MEAASKGAELRTDTRTECLGLERTPRGWNDEKKERVVLSGGQRGGE